MKVHTSCLQAIDFSELDFSGVPVPGVNMSPMLNHSSPKILRAEYEPSVSLYFWSSVSNEKVRLGSMFNHIKTWKACKI